MYDYHSGKWMEMAYGKDGKARIYERDICLGRGTKGMMPGSEARFSSMQEA